MARVWLLMLATLSLNACCCVFGYIIGDDTAYFLTMDHEEGVYLTSMEDTSDVTEVLKDGEVGDPGGRVTSAALDIRSNIFFWATFSTDSSVWSKSLDSGESRRLARLTAEYGCAGVSLDWVHGLLYWTDWHAIHVATYNGSRSARLITTPHFFYTMTSDPTRSALYVGVSDTDGDSESIYRAGSDGSNFRRIISLDRYGPEALVVDLPEDRLYWVTYWERCILSARTDGSDVTNVACGKGIRLTEGLAIFRDYVYVGAFREHEVLRVNKTSGEIETAASLSGGLTLGVESLPIFHLDLQPSYPNQCGENNGGCDYLCLPSPRTDGQAPHPTCLAADSA